MMIQVERRETDRWTEVRLDSDDDDDDDDDDTGGA